MVKIKFLDKNLTFRTVRVTMTSLKYISTQKMTQVNHPIDVTDIIIQHT